MKKINFTLTIKITILLLTIFFLTKVATYNKHEEVKKGFSGSFSPKGISVSYGKDKFSSDTDIVNQTASQIVSNKDINIEATNKVKAKSVDIYAKNDVNISGDNGVEISTANNTYDNTTKQSSSRIGASVGINSAIVNTVENVKDIKNFKKDMPGIDIGDFGEIDDLYFKKIESKSDDKNEKK